MLILSSISRSTQLLYTFIFRAFQLNQCTTILRSLLEHKEVFSHFVKLPLNVADTLFPECCTALEASLPYWQSQKHKTKSNRVLPVTFAQNKYFSHHLRCWVPCNTGLNASQNMLIPTAAIWRHAACCLPSVTPNPTFPIILSSLLVSRWKLHTPAASHVCVYVCMRVCVPTEGLAVQAYSQPAFLTSLMNL